MKAWKKRKLRRKKSEHPLLGNASPTSQKKRRNVWKDHAGDEEYLYDLEKEVVHLQKGGIAMCWADTRATVFRRRKQSCIYIDDPGSSKYCPDCTGWTPRQKKARVAF